MTPRERLWAVLLGLALALLPLIHFRSGGGHHHVTVAHDVATRGE